MSISFRTAFLRHVGQTSPEPDGFEVSHGEGIFLFDKEGNPFIDCISGIAVSSLGHGHPRIKDEMCIRDSHRSDGCLVLCPPVSSDAKPMVSGGQWDCDVPWPHVQRKCDHLPGCDSTHDVFFHQSQYKGLPACFSSFFDSDDRVYGDPYQYHRICP